MDQFRVWISRLIAPLAFLAAATALVIVVQRALDEDSPPASATTQAAETETTPVTTDGEQQTENGDREFYRIRPGDTLEQIATRFDTTVDQLLLLNPELDPLALEPGTRIRVA
jgi:LysM repeat protein